METSLENLRFSPQDTPTVLHTDFFWFCILLFTSRLKKPLLINGKSNFNNGIGFPQYSTPPVPEVLLLLAVTLMRKVLNFAADLGHSSVTPLAVCLIDICCLPTSVPATLVNIFKTEKPFPTLAASCSSDLL